MSKHNDLIVDQHNAEVSHVGMPARFTIREQMDGEGFTVQTGTKEVMHRLAYLIARHERINESSPRWEHGPQRVTLHVDNRTVIVRGPDVSGIVHWLSLMFDQAEAGTCRHCGAPLTLNDDGLDGRCFDCAERDDFPNGR